jgi:nucleotidyltransferase/DNA polymerase involved in DNA repair
MDTFHAFAERRDDPALRDAPVAVVAAARGVAAAGSDEAGEFGVRAWVVGLTLSNFDATTVADTHQRALALGGMPSIKMKRRSR